MKTINDSVFGQLTYNYQWERPIEVSLWGKKRELLLAIESETDDDDSVSTTQAEAFHAFEAQHESLACEMLKQLQQYCQDEFSVAIGSADEFFAHNTPKSVFLPLTGEWAVLLDSEYDEEGGLAVVVRDGQIEVGSQDIIL